MKIFQDGCHGEKWSGQIGPFATALTNVKMFTSSSQTDWSVIGKQNYASVPTNIKNGAHVRTLKLMGVILPSKLIVILWRRVCNMQC